MGYWLFPFSSESSLVPTARSFFKRHFFFKKLEEKAGLFVTSPAVSPSPRFGLFTTIPCRNTLSFTEKRNFSAGTFTFNNTSCLYKRYNGFALYYESTLTYFMRRSGNNQTSTTIIPINTVDPIVPIKLAASWDSASIANESSSWGR